MFLVLFAFYLFIYFIFFTAGFTFRFLDGVVWFMFGVSNAYHPFQARSVAQMCKHESEHICFSNKTRFY